MSEHLNLLKSVLIFTNPKGQHNSSLAYQKMDEVQYQTSIYVATEDIPAGVAISDARWAKKLDNSTAYQAELARQTAEGERERAEDSRETAEGLREEGEIDRGNAYSQAELARDGLYATAESARDGLFAGSQQDRTSAYNLREGQRDSAYDAQELVRDGLYSTAESTRDGLYQNAEASRGQAFDAAEIARNQTLAEGIEAGRLNYKGPYNPSTLYSFNNWVTDSGSSYAYIHPTPAAGVSLTDTSHWQQIAEKGDPGHLAIQNISRVSGDGTPGSTDTYNVTYNNGTGEYAFTVYNGADAPALSGVKQYIIRWDKVNSQCTRMGDAAAITTTITNFCHRGEVNASYSNPFDNLYPWKYRKLCKVNRVAYAALPAGSPITDAVTMWEGEPGFALDGTGDFDGVYTPEFWGRTWQDDTYVYAGVADGPIPGWIHYEATIGGRYFGALDGNGKITSIGNSFPLRNTRMDTMHTNVTAQGMTLDDIWTWSADTLLMVVEYATLNSEIAIGKGVDGLYRQSAEKVGANASVGETVLKLPNAFVAVCVPGALIGLGTTDGGEQTGVTRFISSADLDGADPLIATHKAVTVPAQTVNVTTDTFVCIHGQANLPDAAIGSMSGYIGVNGKSNTYYRGRVSHGNFFRYCLGAYRQTGTGKIWVANSRAEAAAADALNTGVHRDTGLVLPTESNYIAELHLDNLLPLAPFAKATGGTAGSTNPVGDYCYVPTLETGNTLLRLGGYANYGANDGRFCGSWSSTASDSAWYIACLPYLKTP